MKVTEQEKALMIKRAKPLKDLSEDEVSESITVYNDKIVIEMCCKETGHTLSKSVSDRKDWKIIPPEDDAGVVVHINGNHGDPQNLINMLNNFGEEDND